MSQITFPPYLLSTNFGNDLYNKLHSKTKDEDLNKKLLNKLAILGVLGIKPNFNDINIDDIRKIFEERMNSAEEDSTSVINTTLKELINTSYSYPLPNKWTSTNDSILLSNDNLDIKFPKISSSKSYEYLVVKSNNSIPVKIGIFYYEVTILQGNKSVDCSIGLAAKDLSPTKKIGSDSDSYGYNGLDGYFYNASKKQVGSFGINDTIGCGINYYTGEIFYTKNGFWLQNVADDVSIPLTPIISIKPEISINTNFGFSKFKFNIMNYIHQYKSKINASIITKDEESDQKDLINSLIKNYFNHGGFVSSLNSFNKEVLSDSKEDPNSVNRQTMRNYLLKGDVDSAVKFLQFNYPSLLENPSLVFELDCHKLIQYIKELIDSGYKDEAVTKAVIFTKQITNKYPDSQPKIFDISSLITHADPTHSTFSYYLEESERLKLIELVNKEISKSLGMDEVSGLEKIILSTMSNLEILREKGIGECGFLCFEEDFMDL